MFSYLRDNPYPKSPFNRFVKELVDYMTCTHPDLKYQDIMAKIDEDSDSGHQEHKKDQEKYMTLG